MLMLTPFTGSTKDKALNPHTTVGQNLDKALTPYTRLTTGHSLNLDTLDWYSVRDSWPLAGLVMKKYQPLLFNM